MKIISVSGSHSDIGKTSLAEDLLRCLPDWSALKVTVNHVKGRASNAVNKKFNCPRQSDCCACYEFKGDFNIIKDREIVNQENTDTGRLKAAGAKKVVWLKAIPKGLKAGLEKALDQLKDSEGVVIEGTSVLRYIKPDLAIYLRDNATYLRASARAAQRKADIVIDGTMDVRTFAPFAEPLALTQRVRASLGRSASLLETGRNEANRARSAPRHSAQGQKSSRSIN